MATKRNANDQTKTRWVMLLVGLIGATATLVAASSWYRNSRPGAIDGQSAPAAELRIIGRVANARTDQPIRKAEVAVEADGVPGVTESDSKGMFSALVPGPHASVRIRVTAHGFKPYDQLVPVGPRNEIIPVNLEPATSGSMHPPESEKIVASVFPITPTPARTSPLNASLPLITGEDGPWTVILFGDAERRDDVLSSVRSTLAQSGHDTVTIFRRTSDEQRLAPALFRGSSDVLAELQAGRYCSRILIGKLTVGRIGATEGITFARAAIAFHLLSTTGDLLKTIEFEEKGGGEDDATARRHAVDELLETVARDLSSRLS
jgi:hypothetical protein